MVLTYEQLEESRARRVADAEAAANKTKRRRKGKGSALEGGGPEVTAGTTQSSHGLGVWKAPVARMVAADWP